MTTRNQPQKGATFTRALFCVVCAFLWLIPSSVHMYAQETQRTVWDGVYTEEQSKRGQAVFLEECASCHGRDLEGADMTPPLTGAAFMSNWDGLTVGDFADRIRISMPLNRPGILSRQQNADVVAYILRFNQFPAGNEELSRDVQTLKQIMFKASR
jgi:mono/diheme cytochrome c family protein